MKLGRLARNAEDISHVWHDATRVVEGSTLSTAAIEGPIRRNVGEATK